MKMIALWDIVSCSLFEVDGRFSTLMVDVVQNF